MTSCIFYPQYDWTTGVLDNGNEWRKFRAVPRLYPLRSLVCTLFNKGGSRRAFRLPGAGGGSFPLSGGTFARSYSVSKTRFWPPPETGKRNWKLPPKPVFEQFPYFSVVFFFCLGGGGQNLYFPSLSYFGPEVRKRISLAGAPGCNNSVDVSASPYNTVGNRADS